MISVRTEYTFGIDHGEMFGKESFIPNTYTSKHFEQDELSVLLNWDLGKAKFSKMLSRTSFKHYFTVKQLSVLIYWHVAQ